MPPVVHHRRHYTTVVVEGEQIEGWEQYRIETSMIMPADGFVMRMPFNARAWNLLRRDAHVRVLIDATVVLDGFIDRRRKSAADGMLEISGRDRAGRLTQESAPSATYEGLLLLEAVKRLVSDWFGEVSVSDARNRSRRRGKGRRVPAGAEPDILNVRVPRAGRIHPGMTRWQVIEDICARHGYLAMSAADGREIIICKPNYNQAPQFLIVHPRVGSSTRSTCKNLVIDEDNGDRFSEITVAGAGTSDDANYGSNATSQRGRWRDGPGAHGTGRDFLYPKRLFLPERDLESHRSAQQVAELEAARRNFRRTIVTATMEYHGQFLSPSACTIFAPNTIARVVDEEIEPVLDAPFLIYSCVFTGDRATGENTELELVPSGTEIVL